MTKMTSSIEIKTFDGDLEALKNLLCLSWEHDYIKHKQSVIHFTLPYLKWNLLGPKSDTYFHIGAYDKEKLIGFAASFPQTYTYLNKNDGDEKKIFLKAVLSTYFTTHPDYRRFGVGTELAKERIRRHIEKKVEINLFYQDHGHAAAKVYPKFSGYMNSSYSNLKTIGFLIRALDEKKIAQFEYFNKFEEVIISNLKFFSNWALGFIKNNNIRPFARGDLSACLKLINNSSNRPGLFRLWEESELLWELENDLSTTFVFEKGNEIIGLVNYHIVEMIGRTQEKIAQIDNVCIDQLSLKDQCILIDRVVFDMKRKGAIMGLLARLPYFKAFPFYMNLFIPYPRKQHLKLLNYTSDLSFENCDTIYSYYR